MSKPKSKRVGPSEREAFSCRAVLAERERSWKTYGRIGAERGIPVGTLTWWRGELRRRDARRQGQEAEGKQRPVWNWVRGDGCHWPTRGR